MPSTRIGDCVCCGKTGRIHARGLIASCYFRNRDNGTLHEWPGIVDRGYITHGFCAWCGRYGKLNSRFMHVNCYQQARLEGVHLRYGLMRGNDALCTGSDRWGHHCRKIRNEHERFCVDCGGSSP